jgi:hypothetical protein
VGLERAWVTMGFLEIAAQNFETAHDHFLRFLRSQQRVHSVRYILAAVVGTAVYRAHAGDDFTALVRALAVLQHPGVDWETRQRAEALCAELTARLTPDQISQARQEAVGRSFDAILAGIVGP